MILNFAVSFLLGATVGLRLNVKMIAHCALGAILLWTAFGLSGVVGGGFAVAAAIVSVVMLQVGYFASLVLAALGLVSPPEIPVAAENSAAKAAPVSGRKQVR
jgi:hypothetical protein